MESKFSKKVLVVDDNEDLCDVFEYHFAAHGYKVIIAQNGQQAMQLVGSENPDVILSDIRMPDGDGLELLEHLRKSISQDDFPTFVLMSGFTEGVAEIACEMGAAAVLAKPFEFDEMLEHIDGARLPSLTRWDTKRKFWHQKATSSVELNLSEDNFLNPSKKFSIGSHGFFIASDTPPPADSIVQFNIQFSDKNFRGTGLVKWVRNRTTHEGLPGVGIRILELEDECRQDVVCFIQTNNTPDFIPRK